MIRNIILFVCGCCYFLQGNAQKGGNATRDRAVLELDAAALNVRSDATVPIDSALLISSGHLGLSRLSVISEGLDASFCDRYGGWINSGNVDSFIRILPGLGRSDQLKAKWLIGAWYAFQPAASSYRKAVEILIQTKDEARRAGDIEMEAQSYCLLGKAYLLLGDTANSNRSYYAVINNPAFSRLNSVQAKVHKYIGIYGPFIVQTMKLRMDCLTSAFHQYQLLGDTGNLVNTLMVIGYQRFAGGDVKGAEEAALQSLALQKAWSFSYGQCTDDLLVYLRVFLGDYAGALKYAMAALDAVKRTGNKFFEPHAYYRVARVYLNLDDKAAATDWYKRALHAGLERNDNAVIYLVLETAVTEPLNLGLERPILNTLQELLRKNPPSNLKDIKLAYRAMGASYIELRDYLTARRYYLAALKLDEKVSVMKGGMRIAYLLERMGWINLQLREYATSRKYLMTLLSPVYTNMIPKTELYDVYEDLHRVDSALGDYPSAYHHLTIAKRLSDSIYNETQTKQIIDLNVRYQTLQREKLLQVSETKRQLEAQKDANTRKLFYGGFALLGILITMVYIRYYNNQRKNRQLREQKEEIDAQNEVLHDLNDKQTVLLEEKEWLLREIHHRVKNNLQIIASLLSAQSEFLNDRTALRVMEDSQNRVKAMSIIHQKLYNSQNLSSIDMAEYIGDLVGYLRDSFDGQRRVIFNLEIAKIQLDVSKAVPLGLILNEAITNAFKYAFAVEDDARISIRLTTAENLITLEVSDNGRGLAEGFNVAQNNSFGMILMRGMAEDLEGNFAIKSEGGTTITVSFMNSTVRAIL